MEYLTELLSSRVKAEILRLLFGPDATELHVRELGRRAHLNEATIRQELERLKRLAIVRERRDGNRVLFRANCDNPLYPELRSLVMKSSGEVAVLRAALAADPQIQVAFIFGSIASGEAKPDSDLDLMVVGDLRLRTLAKRLLVPAEKLNREINPHVISVAEFDRRKAANDHFLTSVLRGPKLFVIGNEHELERLAK